MSGGTPDQDKRAGERPEPQDDTGRSGEGAKTALEALIRRRKLAEGPDTPDPAAAPAPPSR